MGWRRKMEASSFKTKRHLKRAQKLDEIQSKIKKAQKQNKNFKCARKSRGESGSGNLHIPIKPVRIFPS